ncbi:MAG: 30S ribosomal protein S5 [bacterium]|nr:30S ribosomal protein S5 [bacterium]
MVTEVSEKTLIEKIVSVKRVVKVVKGGRRFSFNALVVVGDGEGKVGVGFGKANEISVAIAKGIELAKKCMIKVSINKSTIPCQIIGKFGAAKVLLKPAKPGTGIVAGGPIRAIFETVGVKDILTKSLGSSNPINNVYAAMEGIKEIERILKRVKLRKERGHEQD